MRRILIVTLSIVALASNAIAQIDPFDAARNLLQSRQNAEALAIIDSGQFDMSAQTSEGFSLLHYAAGAGNLEMVKALIARGADPSLKSESGVTPYQMAIGTMVQTELRKAIKARTNGDAAMPAPGFDKPVIAASVLVQPTAAVQSTNSGLCAMVRGESINDGRSPAQRPFLKAKDAIWYNHPDELEGLIEDCVGVDQQDQYGWTLLHHAADRDRVALAKLLLVHGAGRNIRNQDGQVAAQLATSLEMRQLLGPARPAPGGAPAQAGTRKLECRQKYEADVALASDSTSRMSAMRRWQECLSTGRYW